MLLFLVVILLLAGSTLSQTGIEFQDITKDSGLQTPLRGMMGHAAAWGDFDKDGRPDLFVGGFCDRPDSEYLPAGGPVAAKLFHNLGNEKWEVLKNSPVEFCGRTTAAVFADLDNDSFPELYAANNSKGVSKIQEDPQKTAQTMTSKLFKNARGSLVDISKESGASPEDILTARAVGVLDYNKDGLLDLLVVEDKFKKKGNPHSVLLKNKGNLKFQNVNAEAGIPDDIYGFGLAIADLNNDDRPDFFVPHGNRLFLSRPGNKYREATELQKVFGWDPLDNEDWPSGAAFGDLNLDGNLDLVVSVHHDPARNKVYLNHGLKNGLPVFEDATEKAGLAQSVPAKTPHVEIQDFDNDGLPDIYTTAAWKEGDQVIPLIYRNEGIRKDGYPRFAPIRAIKPGMVYFPAGPTADFNSDGKLDIFLVSWFPSESSRLLKNQTKSGNWLQVQAPIGSRIRITSGAKLLGYQQLYIGFGFASGQLPICHFGLGSFKSVDLEVEFPSGTIKKSKSVTINRSIEFKE